jgi:hypothetical protein
MPYLVASIIAVVSAMIILLTRYESDDSSIRIELDRIKSMIFVVDGFVDTYIQSGGDLSEINFEKLYDDGILTANIKRIDPAEDSDNVKGDGFESKLTFPESDVSWQLIPNIEDNTSYKILVDMSANSTLKSRAGFAESFLGKEYCQKALFGEFLPKGKTYDGEEEDKETFEEDGNEKDGLFVCIIYK